MKCEIKAKLWKSYVDIMASAKGQMALKFEKKGLDVRQMDNTHTALVAFNLPAEVWNVYDPVGTMVLNVNEIKGYLVRLKADDVIVLSGDLEKEAKVAMGIRSRYGFRRFGLPVLEVTDDEREPPPIVKFVADIKAKIAVQALAEAVADAEGITGSKTKSKGGSSGFYTIEARREPERLVIHATEEGTFRSSWYEFKPDLSLMELECSAERMRSIYGVAQTEMVLKGTALSNIIKVEFSEDLPVRFTYQLGFPGKLEFSVAPRIPQR